MVGDKLGDLTTLEHSSTVRSASHSISRSLGTGTRRQRCPTLPTHPMSQLIRRPLNAQSVTRDPYPRHQ